MPPFLAEILKQVGTIWKKLDASQRLVVGSVLTATVLGLVAIVWWAGRPEYEVIFVAEDARQLETAEQALVEDGIAYRVEGRRILVDRGARTTAGTTLRGASLEVEPLADEMSMLSSITLDSESRRRLQQKYDEREVEAALKRLPGVLEATVDAHRPPRSPFRSEDAARKPTASVILHLGGAARFESLARMAIPHAAAGLGIPAENITVTDAASGRQFGGDADMAGMRRGASDLIEKEAELARDREQKAQRLLDQAFGELCTVAVNVTLDRQWEQSVEKIQTDPNNPALRSEERTESGRADTRAAGDPAGDGAASTTAADTREETRSREMDPYKGEVQRTQIDAKIASVTAAVVVDRSILATAGGTSPSPGSESRVTADDIRRVVAGAIGLTLEEAADAVHVLPGDVAANRDVALPPAVLGTGEGPWSAGLAYAPAVGQVVLVLAILWFLRSLARGPRRSTATSTPAPARAANVPDIGPQSAQPNDDAATERRRDIERGILDDPAAMSRLLESWLAEQKT